MNNSGSVNFHPSTTEAWTHKTGVAVPGLNETLTLSAYFYNAHNAGYSGLGFAVDATNEAGTLAKITSSSALGMCFHGGGGYFFNNSDEISTTWGGGDLSLNTWYKMIYTITYKGSNVFDATIDIWESDSAGNLSTHRASKSATGLSNADIATAGAIYPYCSNDGERAEWMDDFYFDGSSVPLPVELSSFYAEAVQEGVKLHWATTAEINNAGFYLYRDGQKITNLIPGYGTTNEPHEYTYLDTDVTEGKLYTYQISDIEEDTGLETFHPEIAVIAGKGMVNNQDTPSAFALHEVYPNPFNPTTNISFDLPESANLRLAIYDVSGKLIKSFADGEMWAGGSYSVIWNGDDDNGNVVSSGTYFCKMVTEQYSETKAMVLLK